MRNFLIILSLALLTFACNNNNTKEQAENQQNESIDDAKVEYEISTLSPEELKEMLPDTLLGFSIAPFSKFSAKESDRIIHTAKHQFFNEAEQKSVVMDITDYGSIDYVPFSEIYSNPPLEVNMAIDTLSNKYYRGYMIWSPVDYTGRLNVISNDRFVLQIRSTSNDTIDKFLKNILNSVDFEKLEKLYQSKIKK